MATNNPRKHIPHSDIFDYWKDKAILEDGRVVDIKDVIGTKYKYKIVVYDWGEPCCWACDKPIIGGYEKKRHGGEVDYALLWNDDVVVSKLQRCHIVPRALGGEDVPNNLFLMCERCHELSPDTTNRSTFFMWVYDQLETHTFGVLSPKAVLEKVQAILKRRGLNISIAELSEKVLVGGVCYEDMKEYMSAHVNTHFNHYSEESLVNGFVDWLVHKYVDEVLK